MEGRLECFHANLRGSLNSSRFYNIRVAVKDMTDDPIETEHILEKLHVCSLVFCKSTVLQTVT